MIRPGSERCRIQKDPVTWGRVTGQGLRPFGGGRRAGTWSRVDEISSLTFTLVLQDGFSRSARAEGFVNMDKACVHQALSSLQGNHGTCTQATERW